MKIAAARAIAELAREDVPDEVAAAYGGGAARYGPQNTSSRCRSTAKAAMDSVAALVDMDAYRRSCRESSRSDAGLQLILSPVRASRDSGWCLPKARRNA